jgi:hypothetical protein
MKREIRTKTEEIKKKKKTLDLILKTIQNEEI